MEEASRCGQTETDLEHMLEALAIDEGAGGEALRDEGLTLDAVRAAVAEQHADQLQSIGVAAPAPAPGRITFYETEGYNWTRRAAAVFERADQRKSRAATLREPSAGFLRALLAEPSGQIEDLLARLGTSRARVLARLDGTAAARDLPTSWQSKGAARTTAATGGDPAPGEAQAGLPRDSADAAAGQPAPGGSGHPAATPGLTVRRRSFVPAPPAKVWALLDDPSRMPDWDPYAGAVEALPDQGELQPGATWTAVARTRQPGGKPSRVDAPFRRRATRLVAAEAPRRIVWAMRYPDAKHPNPQRLEIDLTPAPGGSGMTVTARFPARTGWRGARSQILRPLHRFATSRHLGEVAGAIGRQFR
jgi:uncharacterized protein YndB with AHSA1/START domain